jgi:SAM-dependent methyltransferase
MTPLSIHADGLPPSSDRAIVNNRETVEAYERCARDYANATAPHTASAAVGFLHRFTQELAPRGHVLEIGSGPGWDADVLEAHGAIVRRTDITKSFLAFQQERGKAAEHLDVIADGLGGPYDGIVALYVLHHIDRSLVDAILHKVAGALRPGGIFLVSLREGTGERCERGADSGVYHVTLWQLAAFKRRLKAAGLSVEWNVASTDAEGNWMTLLAKKRS